MNIRAREAADKIGAVVHGAADSGIISSISTDTRTIKAGDCFVALKGENFDGHEFAGAAVDAGATSLIVEREMPGVRGLQLIVPDTLTALGEIARLWRSTMLMCRVAVYIISRCNKR